ncbi:hypothetical protein MWU59_06955 [Flavobacteriaceae bacterium F08102]|nr:hypothetical protein [Flavobacteriaceae bacterium F08102]
MKLHQLRKIFILSLYLFSMAVFSQQTKQNISVLLVGYDPATQTDEIKGLPFKRGTSIADQRYNKEIRTRFDAWKTYLKKYFTKVGTADARLYKTEMSDAYDVTIFDQTIQPWKAAVRETKEDGSIHYEAPKYLTEDFDHASIFIAETAPQMGQSIGTKLDWLCLCLDAEAHHIKTEHPIFKGPFKVNLTMVTKPTPEGIFHYPSGNNVPKEIPMWRVQKEGYLDGKGYRIGLVSRGDGFLDSPDVEYISSGVNSKDVGAVAIGRHANMFLWGFSGSPDYMTDEAKQVFANAVVYMKQFKGVKPIARKYNDRIATKVYIDNMVGRLNKDFFNKSVAYYKDLNEKSAKRVAALKARKAKGEKLTKTEEMIMKAQSRPMEIPDWATYVKNTSGKFFNLEYVDNVDALKTYLLENRKYMYSEPDGFWELKIDEDVKKLGIGNDDIRILDTCVSLLKKGNQKDLANRILKRYTGLEMSPSAWEKWLNTNRNKLFFTESGQYKWLIDTTK